MQIPSSLPGISSIATLLLSVLASTAAAQTPEAAIRIHVDRSLHKVSRHLTGSCIEDVNHEIYGGIYSQMLFGESFQEPMDTHPEGFRVLGGRWQVRGEELHASGVPGDKLISELAPFADGEVGVEVHVPDRSLSNAGLIVRVADASKGVDSFEAYEVSLNASGRCVVLGRHRHNWEHIRDFPCDIPVGRWVPLTVRLDGPAIEILVDAKSVGTYRDEQHPLARGSIGLRQFQAGARYRRLWVKNGGERRELRFASSTDPDREVSGMWRPVLSGTARGAFAIEERAPFVGRRSQRMCFRAGEGKIGVENQGLNRWGLSFQGGKPYEGIVWARCDEPVELSAALESADGQRLHSETRMPIEPGEWRRLHFTLTPQSSETRGRFTLALSRTGSVLLGYAFLQPGEWGRFKGLPVRRDVVEGLIDQGITVLRYGGSMVNHPEYRWKNMIGPRDRRPPYTGTWYPYSTNGWGIVDFLDLCEAAGFASIPAFNMGESPADMADFIEYANGMATSEWGKKRAADGRAAPYHLKYIELGNEERVDEAYFRKFQPLAEAIWARDPDITIVVGDFLYSRPIRDPNRVEGAASGITNLDAQRKILELARKHDREVWFDLHVGTDGPRPDSTLAGTFSYIDALQRFNVGAKFKVAVFELNAGNHSQRRALANALAINAFERDGRVPVVTSANCLQPDGQNDNDWNQGLLFLNPSQVWLQPPGYVGRMFSRAYQPELVACEVGGSGDPLDVIAARSGDRKVVVLRAVNPSEHPVAATIQFEGFVPARPEAEVSVLSGPLESVNTAADPHRIVPETRRWAHGMPGRASSFRFPPYSVTTIRFE